MNIGDFGLVPMRGDAGRAIRFGQWLNGDGYSDFEHAFVYVGDGQIVEGQPGGAALHSLDAYPPDAIAWYSYTGLRGPAVAIQARSLIGTPYSYADYFALAALRFHLPIAPILRRYVSSTGHMICSQLVDSAYQRAGVALFNDERVPGDVTPGDLFGLISDQRTRR